MLYLSPVYRSETLTYTVQPEVKEDATLSASAARRPLPPSTTIGQGAKKLIYTTNFLLTSNHILISTLKTRTDNHLEKTRCRFPYAEAAKFFQKVKTWTQIRVKDACERVEKAAKTIEEAVNKIQNTRPASYAQEAQGRPKGWHWTHHKGYTQKEEKTRHSKDPE
jgi:hypothetical protein